MKLIIIIMLVAVTGCGALNTHEKVQYQVWEDSGTLIKEKQPEGALMLGLLFGAGSFYTRNPALGVVSLLLWPVSIVWDGPVAVTAAKRINYDATAAVLNNAFINKLPVPKQQEL